MTHMNDEEEIYSRVHISTTVICHEITSYNTQLFTT